MEYLEVYGKWTGKVFGELTSAPDVKLQAKAYDPEMQGEFDDVARKILVSMERKHLNRRQGEPVIYKSEPGKPQFNPTRFRYIRPGTQEYLSRVKQCVAAGGFKVSGERVLCRWGRCES